MRHLDEKQSDLDNPPTALELSHAEPESARYPGLIRFLILFGVSTVLWTVLFHLARAIWRLVLTDAPPA